MFMRELQFSFHITIFRCNVIDFYPNFKVFHSISLDYIKFLVMITRILSFINSIRSFQTLIKFVIPAPRHIAAAPPAQAVAVAPLSTWLHPRSG